MLIASSALSACSEQITKHGHSSARRDFAQVTPGMGQEQVKLVLGSPTTTSTYATGSAYYYISSTATQTAFMQADRESTARSSPSTSRRPVRSSASPTTA